MWCRHGGEGSTGIASRISTVAAASRTLEKSLCAGFLQSVVRWPERPALEFDGTVITYAELHQRASAVAAALDRAESALPLAAVFAHRSVTAYVGVLGALLSGRGYVPLNRTFPPARTRAMLARSGAPALVVDAASAKQLDLILQDADPLLIVLPELDDAVEARGRWPRHEILGASDLGNDAPGGLNVLAEGTAYLLFTSGSSGKPKGIGVTHANARHFLDAVCERYDIDENDRLTQTFDLTFDLSVFDLFAGWSCGACVCAMPEHAFLRPDRYLDRAGPTVSFAVPSLAMLMGRLGMLGTGRYPTLRWSLFCGEALPVSVADAWADATPNSTLENLYGPTEVTIACTAHRWDPSRGAEESENGLVPIGKPFRGMKALVVDEKLREVQPGATGELVMTGPQVAPGYWEDPTRTSEAFVQLPGREGRWYRTGDVVRRPRGNAPLRYLGRLDHQVKVRGFRVELGEVEGLLREVSGQQEVAVVGWPRNEAGVEGLVGFVVGAVDEQAVLARMAERLPGYMVPDALHGLEELPLNANGKVARDALEKLLDE